MDFSVQFGGNGILAFLEQVVSVFVGAIAAFLLNGWHEKRNIKRAHIANAWHVGITLLQIYNYLESYNKKALTFHKDSAKRYIELRPEMNIPEFQSIDMAKLTFLLEEKIDSEQFIVGSRLAKELPEFIANYHTFIKIVSLRNKYLTDYESSGAKLIADKKYSSFSQIPESEVQPSLGYLKSLTDLIYANIEEQTRDVKAQLLLLTKAVNMYSKSAHMGFNLPD